MLSSIRLDGKAAAMVIGSATNVVAFQTYVTEVLIPTLQPGSIVVMDNLSPHKCPAIAEVIKVAEAEVWSLPPYSPDFNPIEKMWSKIKAFHQD